VPDDEVLVDRGNVPVEVNERHEQTHTSHLDWLAEDPAASAGDPCHGRPHVVDEDFQLRVLGASPAIA
jgi:hypothetical protein